MMAFWSLPDQAKSRRWRARYGMAITSLIVALSLATQKQISYWNDSLTLWEHDVKLTNSKFGRHHLAALHFNSGVDRFQHGDVLGAIADYRRAISLDPTNQKETYCNLGADLAGLGRETEAIEAYGHALHIDPNFVEAHLGLGVLLDKAGKEDEAAFHFQQALAISPKQVEAHIRLGDVRALQGDGRAAADEYREALRLKPGYGPAVIRLRQLEEAESAE